MISLLLLGIARAQDQLLPFRDPSQGQWGYKGNEVGNPQVALLVQPRQSGLRRLKYRVGALHGEVQRLQAIYSKHDRGRRQLLFSLGICSGQPQSLAKGIGEVEGEFLKVGIQPWLAEKLRIGAGSLVIVDNVNGQFTITRSAANDEAVQLTYRRISTQLRDLSKAGDLAQPHGDGTDSLCGSNSQRQRRSTKHLVRRSRGPTIDARRV